jgi:hypothetical protein
MNYSLSDKERAFGERLRADAWRAMKETDARTRNRQNDVTKKLGMTTSKYEQKKFIYFYFERNTCTFEERKIIL